MAKYYKLIDIIDMPQKIRIVRNVNKRLRYETQTLYPGETYEIPEESLNDTEFIESLKNCKIEQRLNTGLKTLLENNNIEYTIKTCPSCSGRIQKLKYGILEVF